MQGTTGTQAEEVTPGRDGGNGLDPLADAPGTPCTSLPVSALPRVLRAQSYSERRLRRVTESPRS